MRNIDMSKDYFKKRVKTVEKAHDEIVSRKNKVDKTWVNGWYERYREPVITHEHIPLNWRYDYNPKTNPFFLERLGVNAAFNPGAIELDGKIYVCCRVEGYDRKSFFAIAESKDGINNFKFFDTPVFMPETDEPDTNVYDMRLVKHEDGWIYGIFCSERKDKSAPAGDTSSADAQAGICRTKDLKTWQRLPDLKSPSPQQRNVVLLPEFVNGKYAFYTRPQDGFIDAGSGGGIGFGLADTMENAIIEKESIVDSRIYHTIKEVKNGLGPAPIKTKHGYLHLAHGVRGTASGLRYVLYMFMTALDDPSKLTHSPGGHFMAPLGEERVGDLVSILFSNGWVMRKDGTVIIYYASCDTRIHAAKTHIDILLDYVMNTPKDPLTSQKCVSQRIELIENNKKYI